MADEKSKGYGGIFSGLKKMVFTEDYLESSRDKKAPSAHTQPSQPSPGASKEGIITTNMASDEMVQKIYGLVETINKPGIDFFELWNAAEAMGGVNAANLQNAFTTLKVLGLTKDTVLHSGEEYCNELQRRLNADIQKKREEKESMKLALENEKQQLQRDKQDLENKIKLLSSQLAETAEKLGQVDAKFLPNIQGIETKIQSGVNALNVVVAEIKTAMDIVKTTIN